jgi:hypothetical protein
MDKKINKYIYWAPRVLSILLILFLTVFSWDVLDAGYSFFETVLGLFIHNIPAFFLLGVLIISWKYEIVGGIAFILTGITFIILRLVAENIDPWYITLPISLIISGPSVIIGILFLIGWFKKKN